LIYRDGIITESVGLTGQGGIYRYPLGSSTVQSRYRNPWSNVFFEGIDQDGDRIVLLTWLNQWLAVYSSDLVLQRTVSSPGEGWGLCFDGEKYFKSNGSSNLTVLDRDSLTAVKTIPVTWNGSRVTQLNELECAEGWVLANIYYSTNIVIIHPETGKVHGVIDGSALSSDQLARNRDAVLNGIAYRPDTKTLILTGKMWNKMVEIEFPDVRR
jgi:glutaminyl-peptide cyclotransferase